MNRRVMVQVVTTVVVLVFAVGIWSTGDHVNPAWLRFFSAAIFVATIVLWVWERWLWRVALVQRIPIAPRDLTGTWRGTLTTFWTDPVTGLRPVPKPAFLVIRQTASRVAATLYTDESSSRSALAQLSDDDNGAQLTYIYLNRPDSRVEHRSRMHNGGAFLEVTGRPAMRIRGRYWTDRDSRGELDFDRRDSRAAEDFHEASAWFAKL